MSYRGPKAHQDRVKKLVATVNLVLVDRGLAIIGLKTHGQNVADRGYPLEAKYNPNRWTAGVRERYVIICQAQ